MNAGEFALLTQHRPREASRRQLLGGIAGAVAVLTGTGIAGARNNKSKGKAKGKGKGHGSASAPGQQPKVGICHFDERNGLYMYLELPPPAAKAHRKHGDQALTEADCLAQNSPPSEAPAE